jgi:uncharacterized membrane protein
LRIPVLALSLRRIRFTTAVLAVLIAAGASLRADSRDYVVLQVPGFAQTIPYAVNERGEVAGGALTCAGEFHGFLYRDGDYSIIDVPGAITTIPTAINEHGLVVGYFYTVDQRLNAFTFWRGQHETISVPGFDLVPQGINSRGDIIGWIPTSPYQAFLLTKEGEFSIFSGPGDVIGLQAWGINASGVIVGSGYSPSSAGIVSFVYRRGEFAITPGQAIYGVNDRGDVLVESGGSIAVYRNGMRLNLDHPEAEYTVLDLSNNRVVGALPAVQNPSGCYETLGFMLRTR